VPGVRYRARLLAPCAHPNITFRCTRLCRHIVGDIRTGVVPIMLPILADEAHAQFPFNAVEAESRPMACINSAGHWPGIMAISGKEIPR
jgi:hypothetical protein